MRRTITQICGRCGKFVLRVELPGDCVCNKSKERAHFVPDLTERFNLGLGEYCCGTRDAEKKAKRKGLVPIGDTKIDSFKRNDSDRSKDIKNVLIEGLKAARSGKVL